MNISAQNIVFNNLVSFRIPDKAKLIKNSGVNEYRSQKGLMEIDSISNKDVFYDIEGITLSIFSTDKNPKPFNIIDFKKVQDRWGFGVPGYSSELKKLSKGEALIITSESGSMGNNLIYAANPTGLKVIISKMDYRLNEKAKAKKIIDKLLERLKFKD